MDIEEIRSPFDPVQAIQSAWDKHFMAYAMDFPDGKQTLILLCAQCGPLTAWLATDRTKDIGIARALMKHHRLNPADDILTPTPGAVSE